MRGRGPHQEAHAGAGIATVDHILGLHEPPDAHAANDPFLAHLLHAGTEGPHRGPRVQHVLPLQQTRHPRLAHRHRPQNKAPVADRLVARHMGLA